MAAISAIYLAGEKRALYATVTAASGTVTVTNPTFSLYSGGSVVSGFSAVAASNTATAATVTVWYDIDTAGLAAGAYYGVFKCPTTASADSVSRTEEVDARLYIRPVIS